MFAKTLLTVRNEVKIYSLHKTFVSDFGSFPTFTFHKVGSETLEVWWDL